MPSSLSLASAWFTCLAQSKHTNTPARPTSHPSLSPPLSTTPLLAVRIEVALLRALASTAAADKPPGKGFPSMPGSSAGLSVSMKHIFQPEWSIVVFTPIPNMIWLCPADKPTGRGFPSMLVLHV